MLSLKTCNLTCRVCLLWWRLCSFGFWQSSAWRCIWELPLLALVISVWASARMHQIVLAAFCYLALGWCECRNTKQWQ